MERERLDDWLVRNSYYPSRARARDAIQRGCVTLGSGVSAKPSRVVAESETIAINDPANDYVSRAALKLVHALEATGLSPRNCLALDLGASTGGFCQVLLAHGASEVIAVDVGHGQMAERIAKDKRLRLLEGLNARDLTVHHLEGRKPEFITCDVSFISLKLALPPSLELAEAGARGIFLVKPQFEIGRDGLGKGGIVRDPQIAHNVAEDIRTWLDGHEEWTALDLIESPIVGSDGNHEFLLTGIKHA